MNTLEKLETNPVVEIFMVLSVSFPLGTILQKYKTGNKKVTDMVILAQRTEKVK